MAYLRCQLCQTFCCLNIALLLSHLLKVHSSDPQFYITCDAFGCQCTFTNANTYKSHLRRAHKDLDLRAPVAVIGDENDAEEQMPEEMEADLCDMNGNNDPENDDNVLEERNNANQRLSALFLMKTKEIHLLSQKAVDGIAEGATAIVRNAVDCVRDGVERCLESAGIAFEAVPDLPELFDVDNKISNPFRHVATRHKQTTFYREKFGLVEPRRVSLGQYSTQRRRRGRLQEVLRDDEVVYTPLLDSLEQLLNKEYILEQVLNGHQHNDGKIEDFCDAQIFRTHPLFSQDPTALQLMLYYDEVEVTNPLGSKTGKHKLGVVYYTLGNIEPKHRSQLDAIQLLAIATVPVIKKHGIDALMEPFMDDLQELEQDGGHQFIIKNERRSLAGTIVFFSGDNLGSQLIGGFKEGPGANLKCRHCMGTADALQTMFCERDFTMRTRAGHDRQCRDIEGNPDLTKVYGVNRRSILCNSRYFHVVNGLPGDAMHDLLEGLMQYECKEMLKVFISNEKYFTLEQLNDRIRKFDYGYYNDKNRPSPITNTTLNNATNSLKQKAAQMWCLGRFLPLMIGNLIPDEDERWQLFILLIQISLIVFSPVVCENSLGVLEGLIEEHHMLFCNHYPGRSIIPKMHYIVHYPMHMYLFGPMVRTWCMRYEAKHRYIKRLAAFIGNFTNLPFSMSERHQTRQCYFMNTSTSERREMFLQKPNAIGNGKQVVAQETNYCQSLQQVDRDVEDLDVLFEAKSVTIHGTYYKLGAAISTGLSNDLPDFALIHKIVVLSHDNIHFLVEKLVTMEYNNHFAAYEIQRQINPELLFVCQSDFVAYLPAHTVQPYGQNGTYVAPRYAVSE